MSRSIYIESPAGSAAERQFAEVEDGQRALRVWNVNGGSGGGGTEYARDAAAGASDVGTQILAVRDDGGGTLVGADGDYTPLSVNASGELRVTGGGGGTQYQEDAAHSSGATGNLLLVVRNDTPGALTDTDGDYASLQVDDTGRLRVTVDSSVEVAINDGGNSLTVDGTVAATQSGTWNVATLTSITNVVSVDDNGGSLTVDGTVAATQSGSWTATVTQGTHDNLNANANVQQGNADVATGNALFVQPGTAAAFPVTDNGGSLTVDGTVAISGTVAVTQSGAWSVSVSNFPASQTVDDGGGSLTVDGSVSVSNFPATYPVTDNGGSLTVDGTVAATQSGSWDIANITTSVTPGTGASHLGKAEDSAHSSGDVGVMLLAVRSDSDSPKSADGDYIPLHTDASNFLKVAANQAGTWNIASITSSITPGTGQTNLGKAQDQAIASGDVGVPSLFQRADSGTPVISPSTSGDYTIPITDSNSRLWVRPIDGDPSNFNCTVRLRDGDNGVKRLSIVDQGDGVTALGGAGGNVPMAEVLTAEPTRTTDQFEALSITTRGRLRVDIFEDLNFNGLISGEGRVYTEPEYTRTEDAAHSSGAAGAYVLTVREDSLASSTSADGDYQSFKTDSVGALWTRNAIRMEALSESTDGLPIQLTGTSTGTSDDLHVSTSNQTDRVTIDLTNTSDSAVEVTIEFGGTGTGNQIKTTVPGQDTVRAIANAAIGGSASARTISAFAGTANVINAVGYVERNV